MKKTKIIVMTLAILIVSLLAIGVWQLSNAILKNELGADYNIGGMRWTILGALGSWAGSVFGAVALVISILAFWQPQRIKIKVAVNTEMFVNSHSSEEYVEAYSIVVTNNGMRPVTITNVYLNFGGKKYNNIFVGYLNQGTALQHFSVSFPKRLEAGEHLELHLHKSKLNRAFAEYEKKTPRNTSFYICVNETVNGQKHYKTDWMLKDFIGN